MSDQGTVLNVLAFGGSEQFWEEVKAIGSDPGFEVACHASPEPLEDAVAKGDFQILLAEAGVDDVCVATQIAQAKGDNPSVLTLLVAADIEGLAPDISEMIGADGLLELPLSLSSLALALEKSSCSDSATVPKTVLVVDDVYSMRFLLRKILEAAGYRVLDVESADAALDTLAGGETVDVVMTDVMMPGISGIQLCEKLKGNPATAPLPVILVTARGAKENVVEGKTVGADGYVVKPFTRQVICAKVEEALTLVDE